jgi:DNA-binding response OmpR family regulator
VIFQTAKASPADISEGLQAGAHYYLSKPFDEDVLLSVIKK